MLLRYFFVSAMLAVTSSTASLADVVIDLGGPATGYLAVSNFKNSTTQAGIEGDANGLPDYANYQMANGNYTAIIASPLDATSDYSAFANFSTGFSGSSFTINNQTITQSDAGTLSAGQIRFDADLLTGTGTETIGVDDLVFDFDTYAYDGSRGGPAGMISPFSPLYTPYNDGSGVGNASLYYNLSLFNVTGSGLTFQDGIFESLDINGDLSVLATSSQNQTLNATFTGTFTGIGKEYLFSVNDQQDFPSVFSDVNMVMNRSGTANVVVPEPSCFALAAIVSVGWVARRHRRRTSVA
ncbi:MAG: hypothetical protein AAF958_04680 [Planctomycetota bacterium]